MTDTNAGADMNSQKEQQNVSEIVQSLHEILTAKEKGTKAQGEIKELLEKHEKAFEKYDLAHDEMAKKLVNAEDQKKVLTEKMEAMEKQLYRVHTGTSAEKSEVVKHFENFITKGSRYLIENRELVKKYLRTDKDPDGGFLVPEEITGPIIKRIVEISPMRTVATVIPTSGKELARPKRIAEPTARWEGEGETSRVTQSKYGGKKIVVHALRTFVDVTNDQLSDSMFSMQAEIIADVSEEFGRAEGEAMIGGDGVKKPKGVLVDPDVEEFETESSGVLTDNDLTNITGELKIGYNPFYMFNRRTLAKIRQIKDNEGRPLWVPTFAPGNPPTINGENYILAIDMPDISVGLTPVLYGDFKRAYEVADNMAFVVRRDDITQMEQDIVRFYFKRRVGGDVVLAEALKKIKIKA